MKEIFRHNQLYTFLLYCKDSHLEKKVLDCGAGGPKPPLAIFSHLGYETHGIEIDEKQIALSKEFEQKYGLNLNIIKGDMKQLPYEDESFSFMYSYNAIFHMSKIDILNVLKEMSRVLKKEGLLFVNFASTEDERSTKGEKVGVGEYIQAEHGGFYLHSFYDENEAEHQFAECHLEVIYKEVRKRTSINQDGIKVTLGYIDYIVRKL